MVPQSRALTAGKRSWPQSPDPYFVLRQWVVRSLSTLSRRKSPHPLRPRSPGWWSVLPFVLVCGCHSLEHSKVGASRCRSLQPAGPSFPVQPLKNAYAWAPHQTHSTSILGWGLGICVVTDLAGDSGAASKTGCVAAPPAFQMQHLPPSAHGRCCRDPPGYSGPCRGNGTRLQSFSCG